MKPHKKILAQIAIEKSDEAFKASLSNLDINLSTAQNRVYYSVFYLVLALSYLDDFVTKSHHKLMGQFNKRYIYQKEVFDKSLAKIYSALILNREIADYDLTSQLSKESILKNIEKAKVFIKVVKPYILEKLSNEG